MAHLFASLLVLLHGLGAVFGGTATPTLSTAEIQLAEEAYKTSTGAYLQVIANSKVAPYETGTVAQKLGADVPTTTVINIYDGPKGKGYQIIVDDGVNITATGYGPEAADFTYTIKKPLPSPTSTPSI